MEEWTDGSLINNEAVDNLTDEQVEELLEMLKNI
jgi:NADH:ubiquinone oxidoreductase subunit E